MNNHWLKNKEIREEISSLKSSCSSEEIGTSSSSPPSSNYSYLSAEPKLKSSLMKNVDIDWDAVYLKGKNG